MSARWLTLALLALAAALWLRLQSMAPPGPLLEQPSAQLTTAEPDAREPPPWGSHWPDQPSASLEGRALAYSLRGSEPDGQIRFDEHGQLIIDRALRRRFDYWLSGAGEISLARMRQLLSEPLAGHYSSMQIDQLLAEFDRYLDYLRAVSEQQLEPAASLHEQLAELEQLQQHWLGEERAEAWFGEHNRYMARSLAILAGEISPGEADSDPWADELLAATSHHADVVLNRDYLQQAIDPQQRYLERRSLYGEAAAERLADLDAQRSDWQRRLDQYAQHYRQLQAAPNLTASERAASLLQLRQQGFSEPEQRRLLALQHAGLLDADGDTP